MRNRRFPLSGVLRYAMAWLTLLAGINLHGLQAAGQDASSATPEKLEFFEKKIRPLLTSRCYACHSADTKPAGGLRVDDLTGITEGGNSGAGIVPGEPDKSNLLARVTHVNPKRRMPQDEEPLTDEQIADLRKWIADGAAWPPVDDSGAIGESESWYASLRETHWAWQPLSKPTVPEASDTAWTNNDIDRFLIAKLTQAGLAPNGEASKRELIRRVTYDLTGLPPTPEELQNFIDDSTDSAFEKVIDRLLASSAFGEHWGRHWLDIARYGESTGPSRNIPYPHAWRYRDYVIEAIQRDVPYDRFLQEQIAGDLLPANSNEERNRLSIATGFLAIGVKDVNQRFKIRFDMDNVDEQIDVVSKSVLGLTVSCARCHDHKFDPIPTTDYYALAGIFTSTTNAAGLRNQMGGSGLAYYVPKNLVALKIDLPPPPEDKVAELTTQVAEAKAAWDAIRGTPEGLKRGPNGLPTQRKYRDAYEKLQSELNALTDPAERGGAVHGVREAEKIADTHVRIRGEAEKLGELVPRGFLTAFKVPDAPAINPEQSGRLELAAWLTSPQNPLTARVAVNRVWSHLFGRGLVSTVDNFGLGGDSPTHPELLDHLAYSFIEDGWSVKRLIKRLVITRAYRLSAEATEQGLASDPENKLVWRHLPRRLTAEEMRDSVLAVSGSLERQRVEGSPTQQLKMIEMRDNGREARAIHTAADAAKYRSVYLPLLRGVIPRSLEVFDPVEQTLVTGKRDTTTVPSQALFMLNSDFVRAHSLALAERLIQSHNDESKRIEAAYEQVLGRLPNDEEIAEAKAFLSDYALLNQSASEYTASLLAENQAQTQSADTRSNKEEEPVLDPDQMSQDGEPIQNRVIAASSDEASAWLALVQALLSSAEFRYNR